jgi:putative endonuclease
MKTPKRLFGDWGEQCAATFLTDKGYEILERNYRVKSGELDIIAWHGKKLFGRTLCFVEVKTRRSGAGTAERATDAAKLLRMSRAARSWCAAHHISLDRTPIQFEQVSVYGSPSAEPAIAHYEIPLSDFGRH